MGIKPGQKIYLQLVQQPIIMELTEEDHIIITYTQGKPLHIHYLTIGGVKDTVFSSDGMYKYKNEK
jgi:hypothetical protein